MHTPSHARIMNGMTTEMTRFDQEKGRYSNTAPRFPLRVLRIPSRNRHFGRFSITDACTRTPAPARTQKPPEATLATLGTPHPSPDPSPCPRGDCAPSLPARIPELVTPSGRLHKFWSLGVQAGQIGWVRICRLQPLRSPFVPSGVLRGPSRASR